jgi:hypothetical protein
VQALIEAGILYAARQRLDCWLVTFTSRMGNASASEYERSFRCMRTIPGLTETLRRGVWTLGLHQSGAMHVHATFIAPEVSKATVRRAASDVGLGWTNLKTVGGSSYDARNVARYLARELPRVAANVSAKANRPASFARQWPAGGITEGRSIVFEVLREQRTLAKGI